MRVYSHRLTWHAFQWMKCSFCASLTCTRLLLQKIRAWMRLKGREGVWIAEHLLKAPQSLQINGSNSIFGGFSSANGGFIKKRQTAVQCRRSCVNNSQEIGTQAEMDPRISPHSSKEYPLLYRWNCKSSSLGIGLPFHSKEPTLRSFWINCNKPCRTFFFQRRQSVGNKTRNSAVIFESC